MKGLDGRTVCAADCLGAFLATVPDEERAPPAEDRPDAPPAWGDGRNYGSGSWYE